jgi:hypothetical protein
MLEPSICVNERLLGGIFRVGRIARIAHYKLYYPGPVLEHQPIERPAFTGLGTSHEVEVAYISARCELARVGIAHACGSELGVDADGVFITKE